MKVPDGAIGGEMIKTSQTETEHPTQIHALEFFPKPYPKYPKLITRTIHLHEAEKLDVFYKVSEVLRGENPSGDTALAKSVITHINDWYPEDVLAREHFFNVLFCFCYMKHRLGESLSLTWKQRRGRGTLIRNLERSRVLTELDKTQVDEILEAALQRYDFRAIRTLLAYEGYPIPVKEPNDFLRFTEWDSKTFDDAEDIEIQITPEEYELWKAPLEMCEPEPAVDESAEYKAFAKSFAFNVPYKLEHAIRQRDIDILRMLLRLYGHEISPIQSGNQDDLLAPESAKGSTDKVEPNP